MSAAGEPKIERPILRYFGGKWTLAPWIISFFNEHKVYVEPFCGAASVFFRKDRCEYEILNDKDQRLFNLFKIFQNPTALREFKRRIAYVHFSQSEFECAYEIENAFEINDEITESIHFIVQSFFGYGSTATSRGGRVGFRSDFNAHKIRPETTIRNASFDWANWKNVVDAFAKRLEGVVIRCEDAFECIVNYDTPQTLFYVDPPYIKKTRSSGVYKYELNDAEHIQLVEILTGVKGMVIVSGYDNDLYNEAFKDWGRYSKAHHTINGLDRNETIWVNPRAHMQGTLFDFQQ